MDEGEFPSLTTFPSIIPDVPGDEPVLLTGMEIREQLADLGLGVKPATRGAAIALCESPATTPEGEPAADFNLVNEEGITNVWGPLIGGFQIRAINSQFESGLLRDASLLPDPVYNIASAAAIWRIYGWEFWSSYETDLFVSHYNRLLTDLGKPVNKVVVGAGELTMRMTDNAKETLPNEEN